MLISIALALYNGDKYLQQLLDSLLKQEVLPYEIVALDDCSTDKSAIIFKSLKSNDIKLRYYKNEKNLGPAATFKKLVSFCEGDCIAFCDQDDIWMPNKLSLSLAEMRKMDMEVPCVVFTDLTVIDDKNKIVFPSEFAKWRIDVEKYKLSNIFIRNIIVGCTALINRQMAIELEKMPLNATMHDHWIALIAYGFGQYKIINKPTVYFRSHSASVTKKERNPLFPRIINSIKLGKSYLKENFEQVKSYKQLYLDRLDKEHQTEVFTFLKLEKSFFLEKRRYAFFKKMKKY